MKNFDVKKALQRFSPAALVTTVSVYAGSALALDTTTGGTIDTAITGAKTDALAVGGMVIALVAGLIVVGIVINMIRKA